MISLVHSGALGGASPERPNTHGLIGLTQMFGLGATKAGMPTARARALRRAIALLLAMAPICIVRVHADDAATRKHPAAMSRSHKGATVKTPVLAAQASSIPPEQLAPKPPDWPANDQPKNATVEWNSKGLRVEAANSSLQQILNDVATATGIKVSGLESDQRIFGIYGPGTARDIISQLIDGSGYNVLMIGEQGQGTPRQIVLSKQPKGTASASMNSQGQSNDDSGASADVDEQPQAPPPLPPQPPAPQSNPSGFGPGAQPRTPQQILQEMQQRQQQIEQMQQQPQRTNPQ